MQAAARSSAVRATERSPGPLRVLTVARWYPSHESPGRGSFVADLVRATAGAGIEARVVSFDRVLIRGRLEERDAVLVAARAAYEQVATPSALFVIPSSRGAPGVPVARLPVVRRPGSGDPGALIEDHLAALRPFVERLVEDWRPDVIHAHTGLPDGIVAAEVGRQLGIPVVVSEHMSTIETELADPAALEAYRSLLVPGVRLFGVSPSVAARVAALLDVPVARIGVLPNPVSDGSFPLADPVGRDPNELLWVGSLGEHKGIDLLLHAFARVCATRPRLLLRLVGGERAPGERERWEALAARLGVRLVVAFEGWLPRDQVEHAMARAVVFVHPSPSETFGVAAAEAILTGLPVAARRSGGVPWIIELSGGFGHVAIGDDANAFAIAIEAVLDGHLPVDAATARARVIGAIGERAVTKQTLEVYRQAIADGVPDPADATASPSKRRGQAAPSAELPHLLVATGRDQALRLVAELPIGLQERLVLIVPPPAANAAEDSNTGEGSIARLVQAEYVQPPPPRPRGRGPLARLRRATWRPGPSADDLLAKAVLTAARDAPANEGAVEFVALDAPAAALIGRLDARRVRLAPGALRWLADRWDMEGTSED